MMEDRFLEKGDIYLRSPKLQDLEGNWYQWFNDPVVTKHQNKGIVPNTREKQRAYLASLENSQTDIVFAIIDKKTDQHIGCAGLHHIDPIHRSAELGIVIGEKEFWGKGYGKLAWNLVTCYGFDSLNLHRIYARIFKDNIASQKAAAASGFKVEGEMRDAYFKNGAYHAAVLVSVLENERVVL
jgi:RimJ/RimL family protein N-acetyltransferase